MRAAIGVPLAVVVAAAGWGVWTLIQTASELDERVQQTESRGEALAQTVALANEQSDESLAAVEAAEALERTALDAAAAESRLAMRAETDRASAEGARSRAQQAAEDARLREEQARIAAEEERRRRREEWRRFGAALRRAAPTESGDWEFAVDLESILASGSDGRLLPGARERMSRLAGVLLANHGYRALLTGSSAATAAEYLRKAGVPDAAVTLGAADGATILRLSDTVIRH